MTLRAKTTDTLLFQVSLHLENLAVLRDELGTRYVGRDYEQMLVALDDALYHQRRAQEERLIADN